MNEPLEQGAICRRVLNTFSEALLGLLLYAFNHIETNLHFLHFAFVDLTTLEYLFCDFDVVVHSTEGVSVLVPCVVLDLGQLKLLLLISFLCNDFDLFAAVVVDSLLELLHACFEKLVRVDVVVLVVLVAHYQSIYY